MGDNEEMQMVVQKMMPVVMPVMMREMIAEQKKQVFPAAVPTDADTGAAI